MRVLIRSKLLKSTVHVKDSYRRLKSGAVVHVSAYSKEQGKIRQSVIGAGLKTHMKWAAKCKTIADAKRRAGMARKNLTLGEGFIWFKEHIKPEHKDQMQRYHGYETKTAPTGIKKEYKAFWTAVVKIYTDRATDLAKVDNSSTKGIDPELLKSARYRMEKDADSEEDDFYLTHPRTLRRYSTKNGKHVFKNGKWEPVPEEEKAPEEKDDKKEVKKSWSSGIMKKHPGARWVTVTDASSPMHGRHILIVPHADGTATIAWAPEKSGLAHKTLHPKEKEKDPEEAKRKADKKKELEAKRRADMSDEQVEAFEQKQVEGKKKVQSAKENLHEMIRDKAGVETEITDKDKKEIEKKIAKLDNPEQKKAFVEEMAKVRDKKKEDLNKIIEEAKKVLLGDDDGIDNTLSEDKKKIAQAIRENAPEFLQAWYEIKAEQKDLSAVNKVLKTGKVTRAATDEIGVRDLSLKGVKEMVDKEASLKAEIAAHYDLIVAARGGIDQNGNEIESKGSQGSMQKEMAKGTMEAITGITGEMVGESIMHENVLAELGAQNAAVLADSYMRERLGEEGYDKAVDKLREYIDKKGTDIAAAAVAKGDKALNDAIRTRKFGKGGNALYASVQQALGASLAHTNRAYAAYGQAEGALNMAAEMLYQVDNKKPSVDFHAANTTALKAKAKRLGLAKGDIRIKKNGVGDYSMTIKPAAYEKLMAPKTIVDPAAYTGEPNAASIKAGKQNKDGWLPAGIKSHIINEDGSLTKIIPDEHQQAAARLLEHAGRVYLNHEAGTGKSFSYILQKAHMDEVKGKKHRTIVSMPSKLMRNFVDEVEKFSEFKCVIVDHADPQKRAKMYKQDDPNTIVIVNKEKFYHDRGHILDAKFDLAINDEAHKLGQRGEGGKQGSKMSQGLQAAMKDIPYYVAGSGTPAPNDLTELYFHLNLMDSEKFNNKKEFMDKYRNLHKGSGLKDKLKDILNSELDDRVHTVKKAKSRVKFNSNVHSVDLTDAQRAKYKEIQQRYKDGKIMPLQRDFALTDVLNNDPDSPKYAKMKELVDHHLKTKGESEKVLFYARNYATVRQIEAFLAKEYPQFSSTRFAGKRAKNANEDGPTTTLKDIRANKETFLTDGKVKFAIHTDAGVEGLNLQHTGEEDRPYGATTTISLASGMHSYANIDQFNSRANRKGANKDVDSHMILTDTPHDMNTEERLNEKKNVMGLLDNAKGRDELGVLPGEKAKSSGSNLGGSIAAKVAAKKKANKSMEPTVIIGRYFRVDA